MKSFLFTAVLTFTAIATCYAQAQNSDFANKLKPEYKLNLNPQSKELPAENSKKSPAELKQELKQLNDQQKNIELEIARMDAEEVSKEDNMYIKMQLSLKYVKGQIAEREKYLQHYQPKK
jgi:cell division protein FtsB